MNSLSKKPYAMIEITVPIGRMFSRSVVNDEQDVKYALILNDEQIWTNAEEHIASMDCLNAENKGEGWTIYRNRVNDGGLELLTLVPDEMLSLSTVSISRLTVAVCSLSVAVIVAVSYLLASSFSKRINVVCQAMQQLQKGRFDRRLKISSYDEIGYLMSVYNQTCKVRPVLRRGGILLWRFAWKMRCAKAYASRIRQKGRSYCTFLIQASGNISCWKRS